jgi:hypothetical protein
MTSDALAAGKAFVSMGLAKLGAGRAGGPPMETAMTRVAEMSVANDRFWPIAKFFCNAKLGRYRAVADIEQASPRSIWLKLPTSCLRRWRSRRRNGEWRSRPSGLGALGAPISPTTRLAAGFAQIIVPNGFADHLVLVARDIGRLA